MKYDFDRWDLSTASLENDPTLLAIDIEAGPLVPMNQMGDDKPSEVLGQAVQFFDTNRLRVFEVAEVIEDETDFLRFEDPIGRVIEIRPLTLERYRAEFQAELVGAPAVASMRELKRLLFNTLQYQ